MSSGDDAPASHRAYAPDSVTACVLTVSDSRSLDSDRSGKLIQEKLEAKGHRVAERGIVRDEPKDIRREVLRAIARSEVDVVIVTGGTGVSPRDVTPDTVEPLLEKVLHGYGEAGTLRGTAAFVTPGSTGAVRLAMDRLILPELTHLVGQLRRD
jgi:molybdenum cofactor biosynthesis protein B